MAPALVGAIGGTDAHVGNTLVHDGAELGDAASSVADNSPEVLRDLGPVLEVVGTVTAFLPLPGAAGLGVVIFAVGAVASAAGEAVDSEPCRGERLAASVATSAASISFIAAIDELVPRVAAALSLYFTGLARIGLPISC